MIIWLASYPKSGNTWVRLFIESLLHTKDNKLDINNTKIRQFPLRKDFAEFNINENNIKEFISNCIICQDKINLDNKLKIFKTHNAFWKAENYAFTNDENTHGTIHIVRDPRNVITSLKNHFNLQDYNAAFEFIKNENNTLDQDLILKIIICQLLYHHGLIIIILGKNQKKLFTNKV